MWKDKYIELGTVKDQDIARSWLLEKKLAWAWTRIKLRDDN
jgi:hypothetical protein